MKHLLTGAAIVAVTAFVMPAFAQPAFFSAPQTAPRTAPIQRVAMHHHHQGVSEDGADQLNQQELQRVQSGASALTPASVPAPMPSNYETPGKYDAPTAPAPVPPSNYQTPGK
jgi:hypothetical protein